MPTPGSPTSSGSSARGEPRTLSYQETVYRADGSTLPVRAEATRQGVDAFRFTARVQEGGEFRVAFETTWRRVN